jgi:hypothetical protein
MERTVRYLELGLGSRHWDNMGLGLSSRQEKKHLKDVRNESFLSKHMSIAKQPFCNKVAILAYVNSEFL